MKATRQVPDVCKELQGGRRATVAPSFSHLFTPLPSSPQEHPRIPSTHPGFGWQKLVQMLSLECEHSHLLSDLLRRLGGLPKP